MQLWLERLDSDDQLLSQLRLDKLEIDDQEEVQLRLEYEDSEQTDSDE